jgi:hypothetical protein
MSESRCAFELKDGTQCQGPVVAGEVLGELIVDEGQARARLTLSVCSEHKEILGPNPHIHFVFSDGMQVSL